MEPSVSVPSDTATRLAATDIADPLLDPDGFADKTYGFCSIQRFAETFCKLFGLPNFDREMNLMR